MYYTNEQSANIYYQLMEQLKKVNSDWLVLRKSRQYKLGLVAVEIIDDLCQLKIHRLIQHLKIWRRGKVDRGITSDKQIVFNPYKSNYFSTERIAIYTAVFGSYDVVPEPYIQPDNCDYYIFTDQTLPLSSLWKKVDVPDKLEGMSNAQKNRYLKMHPHEVLTNYRYSIYVDGNIRIITDLTEYINVLGNTGIGIHLHNGRSCLYDELKALVKTEKITAEEAETYRRYVESEGFPHYYGLLQCSVIAREHHNSVCKSVMENWWQLFMKFGKRDQLYLPLVLFQHQLTTKEVGVLGNNIYTNPSFRVENHIR